MHSAKGQTTPKAAEPSSSVNAAWES